MEQVLTERETIQLEKSLTDEQDAMNGDYRTWTSEETMRREREFELEMFRKGVIADIPPRTVTDEDFDDYEPIEIEGEPISEQIIRERR